MKLDLHTHCFEATNCSRPDVKVVGKIVARVKERGLDGIAITDHLNKEYAYQVMEIVERSFNNEVIIIPGQEVRRGYYHIVELYLPGNCTFRFIAHPGDFSSPVDDIEEIHGVEIENGISVINTEKVREVAQRHGLLLLSNSDAHSLSDIGKHYNDIDLEKLQSRARTGKPR